jgi:hypothetical protein
VAIGQCKRQHLRLGTLADENPAIMIEVAHRIIPADNV